MKRKNKTVKIINFRMFLLVSLFLSIVILIPFILSVPYYPNVITEGTNKTNTTVVTVADSASTTISNDPPEQSPSTITRTSSTETVCYDGKCNLVLYSGVRFIEEDGGWKDIREARSLKNAWNLVYLEEDPDFNIDVFDYNYTSFFMDLNFTGNWQNYPEHCIEESNGDVKCKFKLEIKEEIWNNISKEFEESEMEYEYEFELEEGKIKEKKEFKYYGIPLGKEFSFGGNSTTIKLQAPDTENLDDSYGKSGGQSDESFGSSDNMRLNYRKSTDPKSRVYIKFNISSVPSGQQIENAQLYLYQDGQYNMDPNTASVYHCYNDSWIEGEYNYGVTKSWPNITWDNQPCGTGFDNSVQCNLTAESSTLVDNTINIWRNWTVTKIVKKDYDANDDIITIVVKLDAEQGSSQDGYMELKSKEDSSTTLRPYLNITYFNPLTDPPVVTLVSPTDDSKYPTNSITFNCSMTDNIKLVNVSLYHNISGTWQLNQTTNVSGISNSSNWTINNIPDGTYEWNCLSYDNNSNSAFATLNSTFLVDITKPTISNVRANTTIETFATTILWDTNDVANASVNYGLSTTLGTESYNTTFTTNHSVILSNLSLKTLYYYNVTSCNQAGLCNTTGSYNFTSPCILDDTIITSSKIFPNAVSCNVNDTGNDGVIKIQASNIILDCNNTEINGTGASGTSIGIYINSQDNVKIKNCNVSNYHFGIRYDQSEDGVIVNNTFTRDTPRLPHQTSYAIYVIANSHRCNISNNIFSNFVFWPINILDSNNVLIENHNIVTDFFDCIYLRPGADYSTVKNNNCTHINGATGNYGGVGGDGIRIESDNNIFTNNNIEYVNGRSISIYIANGSYFSGGYLINSSQGIDFSGPADDNTFVNLILANNTYDIAFGGAGSTDSNYFLNVSFNTINWAFAGSSKIYRQWYFDVNVTNSTGDALQTAVVIAWQTNGSVVFNETPDITGFITQQNATEYIENATGKIYWTSYTINVTKVGYNTYTNSSVNFTTNTQLNILLTEDTTYPQINITYPINSSTYDQTNLTLNWTYNETYPDSCWYELNSNGTNVSISSCNDYYVNFTATDKQWNNITLWMNDSAGNTNSSFVEFYVNIDTTNPVINAINLTVLNNSFLNNNNITFSFNATELNPDKAQLWINYTGWKVNQTISYTSNANTSFASINLTDGVYLWNVKVNDSAGNYDWFNVNYTLTVDTVKPVINVINLTILNNSFINNANITFSFNATDLNPDKAELWINYTSWLKNQTISWTSNANTSFASINLTDGVYLWNVKVNDSAGNYDWFNVNYTLTVDTIAPTVTLISPANNTGDNDGNITFNYNVTDDLDIANCSLIINNVINQTNISITKDTTQNFTLNNLAVGSYNWSINCTDSVNNIEASKTRTFSIVKTTKFLGDTTDFSQINVSNITNLIIESPSYGKINFSESVDLSNGADINNYVDISFNRIEINSTALSSLNKSATLILRNLTFSNPRILRDSTVCPSSICKKISYVGGNITFNVTHFTVYSAEETPVTEEVTAEISAAGGSGIYPKILTLTLTEKEQSIDVSRIDKLNLIYNNKKYLIKIKKLTNEFVNLSINSFFIALKTNENKIIDLDKDGINEIKIGFKVSFFGLYKSRAKLSFVIVKEIKEVEKEIKPVVEEEAVEEEIREEEIKPIPIRPPTRKPSKIWVGWLIILLIIVLGLIGYYLYQRKIKSKKKRK